jgi:hypothetical protein
MSTWVNLKDIISAKYVSKEDAEVKEWSQSTLFLRLKI